MRSIAAKHPEAVMRAVLGFLAVALLASPIAAQNQEKKGGVSVLVDSSDAPETAEWGKKAAALVEKWHPLISDMLPGGTKQAPKEVRIVFKKDMKGVAHASRSTITIAAKWIKDHPNDYGMVVHELTHIIQGYPRYDPPWLVEGLADYVRFAHFEPKVRIDVDPKKASYRDSYRTTAKFLMWIEKNHDKDIIRNLDDALRGKKYGPEWFQERTEKTVDELWNDFAANEERLQRERRKRAGN
ncbi:MAG: basic secretory protein-like protein [Gemmataceae bacterium]